MLEQRMMWWRLALAVLIVIGGARAAIAEPSNWKSEWPKTDFSRHSVPFDEIVSGGPPKDGIPPIDDPMFISVAEAAKNVPAAIVVGGGGYNPWTVVRCWAGLWGYLNGYEIPRENPAAVRDILAAQHCDLVDDDEISPEWISTLIDRPSDGAVRPQIVELARGA